jgi:hypothetical protein
VHLAFGLCGSRATFASPVILTDGSEKMILGINLGLFAYTLAILLVGLTVAIDLRKRAARVSI